MSDFTATDPYETFMDRCSGWRRARTHIRQRTGVPGVWPLRGLLMTSAITTYLNTVGRTPPGRQQLRGKPAPTKHNLA